MLKLWNLKVKLSSVKGTIETTGIEEENHELIVWKHWVGFYPLTDFLHHIILRQNLYTFMDILLKTGTYSVCMKREDGTHLYSANIHEISPYMLEPLTGLEHHTIQSKLKELEDLGYISFTAPTKGRSSVMNILLNEYNRAGMRVFQIEDRSWLNEKMSIEKVSVFSEMEDIRYVGDFNGVSGLKGIGIPQGGNDLGVESLHPKIVDKSVETVDNKPLDGEPLHTNKGGEDTNHVEGLHATTVNVIDEFGENDVERNSVLIDSAGFEGVGKTLINTIKDMVGDFFGERGVGGLGVSSVKHSNSIPNANHYNYYNQQEQVLNNSVVKASARSGQSVFTDLTSLSTPNRIVAMYWIEESGLPLTEPDVNYISDSLKISAIQQVVAAIKSTKVWRATLPRNYESLPEPERKRRLAESKPGFFLRKMGMKHVYNFLSNSPRYRKDKRRPKKTGVISGLNIKRVRETQNKILQEIRAKRKKQDESEKEVSSNATGK